MPNRSSADIDLEKDFPQIEDISGTIEINPSLGGLHKEVKHYTKQNLPRGFVGCNSSVCNKGGVSVGDMFRYKVAEMVSGKQTEGTANKVCQGYENMGRGRRRDCMVTFVSVSIHIKYKE
jgi:hypothetical protein